MHTAKQSSTENPVGMLHLDQYLTCLSSVVMWQQKPILASLEMKDNQCIDFDRTLSEKTALINFYYILQFIFYLFKIQYLFIMNKKY